MTSIFPPEARIIEVDWLGDLDLMMSWRLGTDPKRPGKRSKMIQVTITTEALEDYAAAPIGQRQMADARLAQHLENQLARFDPEHHAPLGRAPPVVRWLIGTMTLLG